MRLHSLGQAYLPVGDLQVTDAFPVGSEYCSGLQPVDSSGSQRLPDSSGSQRLAASRRARIGLSFDRGLAAQGVCLGFVFGQRAVMFCM